MSIAVILYSSASLNISLVKVIKIGHTATPKMVFGDFLEN